MELRKLFTLPWQGIGAKISVVPPATVQNLKLVMYTVSLVLTGAWVLHKGVQVVHPLLGKALEGTSASFHPQLYELFILA